MSRRITSVASGPAGPTSWPPEPLGGWKSPATDGPRASGNAQARPGAQPRTQRGLKGAKLLLLPAPSSVSLIITPRYRPTFTFVCPSKAEFRPILGDRVALSILLSPFASCFFVVDRPPAPLRPANLPLSPPGSRGAQRRCHVRYADRLGPELASAVAAGRMGHIPAPGAPDQRHSPGSRPEPRRLRDGWQPPLRPGAQDGDGGGPQPGIRSVGSGMFADRRRERPCPSRPRWHRG